MCNVVSKTCIYENCKTQPCFNYEGLPPIYCLLHSSENMCDVKSKKCEYEGCDTYPSFNYENESSPKFCFKHKDKDMISVINRQNKYCKSPLCGTYANPKYDGYCARCYFFTFPDKPAAYNYKTKEKYVADFIRDQFPNYKWIFDKIVGESKRRPDIFLTLDNYNIIIEVDENQHGGYDCSCENKRLMQLSQDFNHKSMIFIRFNPDDYLDKDSKNITSCWGNNKLGMTTIKKTKGKEWDERLNVLKDTVKYWINNPTDKMVEVIQLFYDQNINQC